MRIAKFNVLSNCVNWSAFRGSNNIFWFLEVFSKIVWVWLLGFSGFQWFFEILLRTARGCISGFFWVFILSAGILWRLYMSFVGFTRTIKCFRRCFRLLRRCIFDFFMNLRCFQGFQQYFFDFLEVFQGCVGMVARIFWISVVFWDFNWYFSGVVFYVLLGVYTVRGFPLGKTPLGGNALIWQFRLGRGQNLSQCWVQYRSFCIKVKKWCFANEYHVCVAPESNSLPT